MARKKRYPHSVAERLLSDDEFQFSNQIAVQKYLAKQRLNNHVDTRSSMVDDLIEQGKHTLPKKYDRLYHYLNKQGRYDAIGFPKSSFISNPDKEIQNNIEEYLENLEQQNISIHWFNVSQRNLYFYAWFNLVEQYGYNFKTNELTKLSQLVGTSCYLFDGEIQHNTEQRYDDEIIFTGLAFDYGQCFERNEDITKPVKPAIESTQDLFSFRYAYEQEKEITKSDGTKEIIKEVKYETLTIDLAYLNIIADEEDDIPNEIEYVQVIYKNQDSYKLFESSYVDLSTLIQMTEDIGEFYPRLYLKLNQREVISYTDDDPIKIATNKAVKRLGLNLKDLTQQIAKGIGEHYGITHYAFLNPAIAINVDGQDNMVAEYLFKYFDRLYDKCEPSQNEFRKGITQQIKDKIYTQEIGFKEIKKEINQGQFTHDGKPLPVGHYICINTGRDTGNTGLFLNLLRYEHTIYYQQSDSQYLSIHIIGLYLKNIFSGHVTTAQADDSELVIPLDKLLIRTLSTREKEYIFNKALHIQISLVKVVKKKWYQTGIFKVVIVIIGLVISYFSAGTGAPLAAKMIAMAQGLVVSTAIGFAIDLAVRLAVKLGLNAKVAAVIALIASIVLSKGQGGWGQAFNAVNVMKALNTAFDVYNKMIAHNINKIMKDMQDFSEWTKTKEKELAKAQAMLNTGLIPLDLELLVSPISNMYLNLGESVDEFYNRTINIDVTYITQSIASDYVENTTTLPSFRDLHQMGKHREDFDIHSILLV